MPGISRSSSSRICVLRRGLQKGLIQEIERVIFEAHPEDQREGAMNFAELLESRTVRFQQSRQREAEAIASISDRIAEELEKERSCGRVRPASRAEAN